VNPSETGFWLIMSWSLVALVGSAVIMLVFNLIQNPPWMRDSDPSESPDDR